ncbi:MAG: molybdenum cofactor guanylyltransferase [Verrucomicrobia bacterium]|nr:molybdenum cofactor guanylyltransferase [Verrucomicrobiota bacterium]
MSDFPFSGAIIAGGQSSRMGRDKAFLTVDGQTLVARQASLLREAGCAELILSGRPEIDYGVPDARKVQDTITGAGPMAGLAAALAAANHPWVLVLAVDLPRLNLDFLYRLLAVGGGRAGVVPHGPRGHEPLAALYPRALLAEAEAALAQKAFALHTLVERAETLGLITRWELTPADAPLLANCNTPEDWPSGPR